MNIKDIKERVQAIELMKGDDEAAHSAEDDLYQGFVEFLAQSYNPFPSELDDCTIPLHIKQVSEMAKEILKTKNIKFSRWSA